MNVEVSESLKEKIKKLPEEPGVYIFKDRRKKVIYIGKASSLRKRVSSYFSGKARKGNLADVMVKEINDIDFVIVNSPAEALILENQFIKQNQPKYNVLLKDDKTYPYIALTIGEEYPRAYLTRKIGKKGILYFGPYAPAALARKLLFIIYKCFGVRQCSIEIGGQDREVCLLYHINRCSGPCANYISKEKYRERVEHARMFLEGKNMDILEYLREKMYEYSNNLQYETAAIYRDAIKAVEQLENKVGVFSPNLEDSDIFGYWAEENSLSVTILQMRKGNIISKREYYLREKLWNTEEALLSNLILQYYMGSYDIPSMIYIPKEIKDAKWIENWLLKNREIKVKFVVPKRGIKKELLQVAIKNAQQSLQLNKSIQNGDYAIELMGVKEDLGLQNSIDRIEAVDISHTYGSYTVGALVVYNNNGFNPKEYKRYRIRRGAHFDDYKALEEVLERHFLKIAEGKNEKPDLLIIDGGIGQLNVAIKLLKKFNLNLQIISIAKKNEEIYLPGKNLPLLLPRHSNTLKIIQKIRDEAHRFAIGYHKKLRSLGMRDTLLDKIKGIGPKKKRKLLDKFKSINNLRKASIDEITSVVGKKTAIKIKNVLERIELDE